MIQISKIIKQERIRCGMTQETLAEHLNTTKTSISKWENETLYPDITMLPKLAKVFNISVDDLLNYSITMTDKEIKKISISLSKMVNLTSYDEYLSTVRDYYTSHSNEFTLLSSLLGLLMNHISYCQNEQQKNETIELAYKMIDLIEKNCDIEEMKKHAKGYKLAFQIYDGKYTDIINNVPDHDMKLGQSFMLAQAYILNGEKNKADSVIQTDMYQSLIVYLQNFTLRLTHDLHTLSIENLEHRIYHLNKAFNIDYLYPYLTITIYYQFAQYYSDKSPLKTIENLEKFCQSFDYLISDFSYHTDEFFNDINEWFKQLPFGQRLPVNYENMLEMLCSSILNHSSFNNIEGFGNIVTKIKQIYLKKGRE